jgi:F-type H+-transporting ATPase subunit epsilon
MSLHFTLVTPERLVRSEDVYMVVVPGSEGDMGILAGHAPVMTTIRDGDVKIYASDKGEPETLSIKGGFAEMGSKGLTILAESVG